MTAPGPLITVFFVYSHRDEEMRNELETHLSMLKREGIVGAWHDRRIGPGEHIDEAIRQTLEDSQIILLLVSSYFLDSDYCYQVEMQRAMQKHNAGSARVIPVILRPCDWQKAPFGKLRAVPKDGKPVTKYPDQHEALLEVAQAVREVAVSLGGRPKAAARPHQARKGSPSIEPPRSSNLRVKKQFSDRDSDAFLREAFEYMANFFEGSLQELQARNPGIETDFTRIDALRFSAAAYVHGAAKSQCRVWLGGRGSFPNGIAVSLGASMNDSSYNESLSVADDGYVLFLRPLGMAFHKPIESKQLTHQGAAEYYWSLFLEPLQR